MSHQALAERVREDDIDILIDLAGHTARNRLSMFALKPAPLQVSWLGYRTTTGLAAIDYVLSDPVMTPPGAERWFVERVVRLPTTWLCYAPLEYAPRPSVPPMLARGRPTFGSFNNLVKTTPEVLRVWARVLTALPDARLLLKWPTFVDPETRARHFRLLEDWGVQPSRVELRGGKSPHHRTLATYAEVDIALDPFPFSGGVSSLEALWQGVPVITLPQNQQTSRQTQAFLTALGRSDWVAENEDDYVRIAVELARNPARLIHLRAEQRTLMANSPLCDRPRFAREFESALRSMWRDWCAQYQNDYLRGSG
jgi:predicted O-linked N-acetylglucosamine transferase (SPINDLY family)